MRSRHRNNSFECIYFDFSRTCPVTNDSGVCGISPVTRKKGQCIVHTTGDASRVDDWVDCYEGCPKHDPTARKKEADRLAKRRNATEAFQVPLEKTPLPTLAKISLLSKHDKSVRDNLIHTLLRDAILSRKITIEATAQYIGLNRDTVARKLSLYKTVNRARQHLTIAEMCDILRMLSEHDARERGEQHDAN